MRPSSDNYLISDLLDKVTVHTIDEKGEVFNNIFFKNCIESVFHLATFFISDHETQDITPLINSNILLGTHILDAAAKAGTKHIIYAGTHWQNYGGVNYDPVNLYAATKECFQVLAKYYINTSQLRMLTLKICDTYGKNDPRNKVLPLLLKISKTQEYLEMSTGDQELGLVFIDDVVKAFKLAHERVKDLQAHEEETYMVAPEKVYTLKEVAQFVTEVTGKELNIHWGKRPYRKREIMKVKPIAKNILENQEMVDLKKGLELILTYDKNRYVSP
ncbi:NAD dependent epimerase/dehydratase family protein [Heliorestis convoluta]|uniref:NAD dependent epimerase/dehydratase family protein n=2 Tax=Heliorestis convoluta TaxID=356322 RepID=A0A5Q2N5J1_9FIRM|nr:NAD dependent epimerase/dehydratase family protein [Heliorestis convoluta]